MTTELGLLGAAIVIGLVALLWAAYEARRQQGLKWAGGPRDEPRLVTGRAARLQRAFANFSETFPLFAAALLAAHIGDKLSDLTLAGSLMYVLGRAAHLVFYAFHLGLARSLAWFAAMGGLLLVLGALFA